MPEYGFINRVGKVFFKQTLSAAGDSVNLVPDSDPAHLENVYIQVSVSGGASAMVYLTSDDPALVKSNDASLTWVAWSVGAVASGSSAYLILGRAMTGIKFTQTGAGEVICGASY